MKNSTLGLLGLLSSLALAGSALAQSNVIAGSGTVVGPNIKHANGNTYDQVLLTGQTVTLQADSGQIVRCSFLDPNGDIVQCEFSGPGQFKIDLDPATYVAPATAAKYNQPAVSYVTGKPSVTISGNTDQTNVNIFTVGKATAIDQSLFPAGQTYDGVADVQLLTINGPAINAIYTGNTRFSGSSGNTGILAPNTVVKARAVVQDIDASGTATPVLRFGDNSTFSQDLGSILLAGGDLLQTNGAAIDVSTGSGSTLASIVTVANIRSDGSNLVRAAISSTVNWKGGASGTLLLDGTAVVNTSTGASSGTFNANFTDLLASSNSPFGNLNGNVNLKWTFSGGNSGTWSVQSTTTVQGFTITSTISGTYTYSLSGDGKSFSFTLNYDQITSSGFTLAINASSNPPLPKSFSVTANQTSATTGTYEYTLTMSNGSKTTVSGNYAPGTPLALPTGS